MKVLVTGAAGFIGSHLCERLLAEGHEVTGVDMFLFKEWERFKQYSTEELLQHPNFKLVNGNLLELDLKELLEGIEVVFHQAAIAGVRNSWGNNFRQYVELNILMTQRLLEACKYLPLKKFVYASTSSIYGITDGSTSEDKPAMPISPYGTSKLAGEHLVHIYHLNFGLPATSLRYFTVYGPRQRPDMAFHKFLKAVLQDEPITLFGNGQQTRDFTYVSDAIEANILAMNHPEHGNVFNIGGAERSSVNQVLSVMEAVTSKKIKIDYQPRQPGDPLHTWADISLAREKLGYTPKITLHEGIQNEWEYIKKMYHS
ncbi:NAD-dependent epimerase/dehydratase family protein [Peribacillus glennii]|uniref:NAD-dependent epimerase/dehydratase family protein n=1 Tax=Peribacillus glennii TaxID=2303991 RepID=A0A372L7T1_9BACI|nr:NAD-dependent epimerase/dehydratase family protein [Peribacillus glennii]RFU61300.1 NAD-dependent epimerase/dehydratase family protein [Peribacillus glennii]